MENLCHAWHKVSKGKSAKQSILAFYRNLDQNLESIACDLKNRTYRPGAYKRFLIKDPKERVIAASPVRDRVVQLAVMNYYDPVFDRLTQLARRSTSLIRSIQIKARRL
jgi:retron-type reverse transcriptase